MTLRNSQVPLSAAGIASLEAVSVANIDSPTELNSLAGTAVGERRLCYQAAANDNVYTVYYWDSADGSGASAPYVMAGSSGFWIACGGKYNNSALNVRGAIASLSTVTGTQLVSNVATGTAPLSVASTTVVPNLNVSQLLGNTWAVPGTIGSTTPNTGAFTTVSASGQITSTVSTGTAPFVIASTTAVANLNASLLLGNTWASPGNIGGTTPGSGTFSSITSNGDIAASGKFLPNNSVSAFLNSSQAAFYGSTGSGTFPFNQSGHAVIEARGGASPRAVVLASAGGSFLHFLDASGNFVHGTAALSTSATDGFVYIPTCAGAPSGTPSAYSGLKPLVFDTTNNKFWIYNGAWKGVVLA